MKTNNSKEKIIKDYEKIVRFVIKNMNLSYRLDDLYDIGIIGFVRGINTYDESKNVQYSTYLYECIKNEILHYLQYEKRVRRSAEVISLNTEINDIELIDLIPTYENYDDKLQYDELLYVINRRLSFLNERDEIIFKELYGIDGYEKLESGEIEKKYKMSKQNVQRIKNKILNILRCEIKDYYRTYQDLLVNKNRGY